MEIAIFFMLGMLLVTVAILVVAVINGMSRISNIDKEQSSLHLMIDNSVQHVLRRTEDDRRDIDEHFNQLHRILDDRTDATNHAVSNLRSSTDSRFDKVNSYVDSQIDRLESNITTTEVANKMKKQQING
jgi:ABC-type lipoprotein release transport system permease subunit